MTQGVFEVPDPIRVYYEYMYDDIPTPPSLSVGTVSFEVLQIPNNGSVE